MAQPRPALLARIGTPYVLLRMALRLIVFALVAPFGSLGFATTLVSLLCLSAVFCAVAGAVRHEAIFGPVLTHWDEAAVYAFVGHLLVELS
jgi:hypothetical protein